MSPQPTPETSPASLGRPQWSPTILLASAIATILLAGLILSQSIKPNADGALPTPGEFYGLWVLLPPIISIILAIALRQVIPAISIGILLGSVMLAPFDPSSSGFGAGPIGSIRLTVEHYLIGALADADHLKVIVFSLLIGGMVGVITASGGMAAVVNAVARWGSTRRRGQLATWLAGLLVFFDDYANAMIVGPSMRPICDRLRISRAKLAYIVDSTAAPVASIALIGTWIGAEVGYIQDGLDQLAGGPDFIAGRTGYQVFLTSIPYRFYPILALVMVVLVAIIGRDFGPMRRAEHNAHAHPTDETPASQSAPIGRMWSAIIPVGVLIGLTLALLFLPGWRSIDWSTFQPPEGMSHTVGVLHAIVGEADPYNPILYAAVAAITIAIALALLAGRTLGNTLDAATGAMGRLLPTIVILTLAWTLSATMRDLELGSVAVTQLRSIGFASPAAIRALPLIVFVSACVVSFATGTSWGTMGILCPAVVVIAGGLVGDLSFDEAQAIFHAAVGAVLAGAVFGDHCSPISDTTVLSSLASDCRLEEHVWTQMPYALVVAIVGVVCGDILCHYAGVPVWLGILCGIAALVAVLFIIGRPTLPTSRDGAV